MDYFHISQEQIARFHEDGYLVVEQLLDEQETRLLRETTRSDSAMLADATRIQDTKGNEGKLAWWNHPSDAVFFHCNTLHRSDQNNSDEPRWSLICCYNTRHNDPYRQLDRPQYTPLEIVSDGAVKRVEKRSDAENNTF